MAPRAPARPPRRRSLPRAPAALLAATLAAWLPAAAEGPAPDDAITVEAAVDAARIGESDTVTLTVEVRGQSLPAIVEPDLSELRDFSVATGPNTSTSTAMYWDGGGAKVESSRKYVYVLLPKRRGTLTIPALPVEVGGRPHRTRPITVEVVQGTSAVPRAPQSPFSQGPFGSPGARRRAETPAGDLYVEAALDRKEAFVGEQVLLTYRLFTQVPLAALPQPKELPSYTGFWVEEIPVNAQATIKRTLVRGKEYAEMVLMKKALFPTRSGELQIEATVFEIPIRAEGDDPFERFFSQPRPVYRRTPVLALRAKPLPEAGRPASFQGAVGSFRLEAETDRKEAQVNDAVELTVSVEGDGNLRTVGDPVLPDLSDYRRYDPKKEDSRRVEGDRIVGSRTWSYVLVPLAAGDRTIPPVRFAYFDPASAAYKELAGPPLAVKVARGSGPAPAGEGGAVRREVVAYRRDIRYIKPAASLRDGGTGLRGTPWFYLLMVLPVAGNAALYAHLRRREQLAANAGLFRRRRASREARRRLKRARSLAAPGREAAFFAEVDRAVTGYVADKFDASAAGLTRERMAELLEARGVPEDLRRRTFTCLERCDFGRFAAREAGRDQVKALLGQAEEVVSGLERHLG